MAVNSNLGLLADYAREVLREYLQLFSDEQPDDDQRMWQGFRVSGKQVARQFKKTNPELFVGELKDAIARRKAALTQWLTEPPKALVPLAELAVMFELSFEDIEILLMAAAPGIDPEVDQLYSYVRNDVHKKTADVGFVCQTLALGDSGRFETYLRRCAFDLPLRRQRLLLLEERSTNEDTLELNLVNRRLRVSDRVLDFLRYHRSQAVVPVAESLAAVCHRITGDVDLEKLALPEFSKDALMNLARVGRLPVLLTGPDEAGRQDVALALAGPRKRGLLSADLGALLNELPDRLELLLAELFREAKLGNDLVYLYGSKLPTEQSGPIELVIRRTFGGEKLVLGLDRLPLWLTTMTVGWPSVPVPLPDADARIEIWIECFSTEKHKPSRNVLVALARRYDLSAMQIQQAALEARRVAQIGRRRRLTLSDLDRACRTHFAHQLGELAQLIPASSFTVDDLVLPEEQTEKFDEILFYAREKESIFTDWGYAEKFPYGRGLSMLFFGPPGTGKTLGAMILSAELGLDLFRVDLSSILSRYVGETEKNLARVFDEAERGQCMLLFDEADSLFTKRTDVQTSVDRYANLEVAYLLQRMENFEGITVLTTNVEGLLDDAFKRRLRYKIYFPSPEAEVRGRLWQKLLPTQAPLVEGIPFDALGEHFEISGGHIKQAVLRAAVYAKRQKSNIGVAQLVEAAQEECRELGMLVSLKLPWVLDNAVRREKGLEPLPKPEEPEIIPQLEPKDSKIPAVVAAERRRAVERAEAGADADPKPPRRTKKRKRSTKSANA